MNSPRPSFEGLNVPPILSVGESLRLLEEAEWKDETRLGERDDAAAALHARDRKATLDHTTQTSATPVESVTRDSRETRRNQAATVRTWTNRQHRNDSSDQDQHAAEEDSHVEDEETDSSSIQSVEQVVSDDKPTPAAGNGLSKLAAWESEIQQLSGQDSGNERMTAEQRAAQAELRRDQEMREQDLKDRLNHERAELDRKRHRQDDDEE